MMSQHANHDRASDLLTGESSNESLPPAPNRAMKLLFATDGSEEAKAAEEFLRQLPLSPGSAIRVLTVLDTMDWQSLGSYLEFADQWAGTVVEDACASLSREGVEVRSAARKGPRAHEIIEAADEFGADLLVIGSRGHTGLKAFRLGSITQNVARHARCSVLVARSPEPRLRRLILALDDSKHATEAVAFTIRLPLPPDTELTVLHVGPRYDPFPGLLPTDQPAFEREVEKVRARFHEAGMKLVQQARAQLETAGIRATGTVRAGDPASEILELATEEEGDLIVIGARGVSPIRGLLLGSVADRVLQAARCSVLVVR